eukprot:1238755-Alexandrium_andersonii.AAC.1
MFFPRLSRRPCIGPDRPPLPARAGAAVVVVSGDRAPKLSGDGLPHCLRADCGKMLAGAGMRIGHDQHHSSNDGYDD